MKTENYSPLDPIKTVLSGPPGTEAAICLTLPSEISLFEPNSADASVLRARQDHDRMRETFEENGIQSFNMRDIIGVELARKYDLAFTSRDAFLQELISRAYYFQKKHHLVPDFDQLVSEIASLFDCDVQSMGLDPAIAINGVLTNLLDHQGRLKTFNPNLPPAGNFLFWRDTNHITGDQMGTHKMFYSIRDQEVALAQIGFDALGLQYRPVVNGASKASIEGGDILPVELNGQLYALIGTAERTSLEAVQAWFLMHENLFSASGDGIIPMVIQGPTDNTQDQMHLDTFTQQIAPGAIIHCKELTRRRYISILMRKNGLIVRVKPENLDKGDFAEWIEQNADHVYNMTREEQLNYAPNVLVHGDGRGGTTVFVTRDGTPEVTRFIRQHAVNTILLRMNELTKFYGGAHCATSEIR
ncbi:MAG: arginine deiminase family protein [Patescibacteria group bacterium]